MFKSTLLGTVFALCLVPGAAFAGTANATLVYASDSDLENVSPYHNNMREGVILMHHVWDGLVLRDNATGKYVPLLATAWKWVDPTTLEFSLRTDVKFHNGDALTADDVAFTVNYVLSPKARW
jgi:peptide/nickel transport system substrate-binding protein